MKRALHSGARRRARASNSGAAPEHRAEQPVKRGHQAVDTGERQAAHDELEHAADCGSSPSITAGSSVDKRAGWRPVTGYNRKRERRDHGRLLGVDVRTRPDRTIDDIVQRLRDRARWTPPARWVLGRGYDDTPLHHEAAPLGVAHEPGDLLRRLR
jgi:hypothetical protein